MHFRLLAFICLLFFSQCQSSLQEKTNDLKKFPEEITQLKDYFHIPGMAVLVKKSSQTIYEDYLGFSDLEKKTPVDSATLFPIAICYWSKSRPRP